MNNLVKSKKTSNKSEISSELLELEKYVEDRLLLMSEQMELIETKYPDAPHSVIECTLGQLLELRNLRIQIWKLGKLKKNVTYEDTKK